MQASYKVVTEGRREHTDPDHVAQRVAALFRCGPAQVLPLLDAQRNIVKTRLERDHAQKYRQALDQCGLLASIEEEAPLGPVPHAMRERLLPRLRNKASAGGGATRRLAGDLVLSYYYRDLENEDELAPDELAALGLTADQILALAVANLHRLVGPALVVKQIRMVPPTSTDGQEVGYFRHIETGGELEAAYLLLGARWHRLQDTVDGALRIMVPSAGQGYFCGADDPLTTVMMHEVGQDNCKAAAAHGLSARLYSIDANSRPVCVPAPSADGAPVDALLEQRWMDAQAEKTKSRRVLKLALAGASLVGVVVSLWLAGLIG